MTISYPYSIRILLLVATFICTDVGWAQLNAYQWMEDLDFLDNTIRNKHLDPFENISEEAFKEEVDQLRQRITDFSDSEIICEMARIVGLIGWGHSRLTLPVNTDHLAFYQGHSRNEVEWNIQPFRALPLRFFLFEDGLLIQSTTKEYTSLIGYAITEIGNVPIANVLEKIRPYMSIENESAFKLNAPLRLGIFELLDLLGLTYHHEYVKLALSKNGQTKQIHIKPLSFSDNPKWYDHYALNDVKKPLWLSGTRAGMWDIVDSKNFWVKDNQYFWFTYLADSEILYIKINQIYDAVNEPIAGFMNRAVDTAHHYDAQKIVIDLRHNMGGSNDVNRSVLLALLRWSKSKDYGKVFVIMGRHTYSAAMMLAVRLEEFVQVVFVGEDTGGKPEHIGDSRKFQLPNSKLTLRVSTIWHHDWFRGDRPSPFVHYPIPIASDKYLNGMDGALDWIKEFSPKDLSEVFVNAYQNCGLHCMRTIIKHYLSDPETYHLNFEDAFLAVSEYLLKIEQKFIEAQSMYYATRWYYPDSRKGIIGYIEACHHAGDRSAALDEFKNFKKIYPDDKEVTVLSKLLGI